MQRGSFERELAAYVEAEQKNIYRLAYSYVRNEQDALDVVQTALTRAFSSGRLRHPEYLKTWMYRIVVNTALDFLRRAHQTMPLQDSDSVYEEQFAELEIREALEALPDVLRTIVILRFFEDLSLQEIADVLQCNLNTVKTRLYKALKLLRIEMEDEHETKLRRIEA